MRASVARNHPFATERGNRLARVLGVELRRPRTAASANAWPARTRPQRSSSQLAKNPTPAGRCCRRHLAAAAREQVHLRVEQGARGFEIRRRLLDARCRDAQVGVVRDALRARARRAAGSLNSTSQRLAHVGRDAARRVSSRGSTRSAAPACARRRGRAAARARTLDSASAHEQSERARTSIASVQLQHQVVHVRADAQDHLAQDVQELRVTACRSPRRPTRRPRGTAPCRVPRGRTSPRTAPAAHWRASTSESCRSAAPGPCPIAQMIESTLPLTMRPGYVCSANSASSPACTFVSSFWLKNAMIWPSASTSVITGLSGKPATNAPGRSCRLIT